MNLTQTLKGLLLCAALAVSAAAHAGNDRDDLKRQIESLRAGIVDLERLDEARAATEDITLLRSWIDDEAWKLYSEQKWKKVREVVDRAIAQQELVRQRIVLSKLTAQLKERNTNLAKIAGEIARLKKATEDARVQKRALEMQTK